MTSETGSVTVPADKIVTLDLNGFQIASTTASPLTNVIGVEGGASLTICDTSETQIGAIVQENPKSFMASRSILNMKAGASVILQSGTLKTAAPVVAASGSSFTMTGGSITGVSSVLSSLFSGTGAQISISGGTLKQVYTTSFSNAYLAEGAILVRTGASGLLNDYEVTDTAPAEYHVRYGTTYYDCCGTITDLAIDDYHNYFDSSNSMEIEVQETGSGHFMSTGILDAGKTVHFILHKGAHIDYATNSFSGLPLTLKLDAGATVKVSGEGTLDPAVIVTASSSTSLNVATDDTTGTVTYTAIVPDDCFSIGENNYDTLEEAIAQAGTAPVTITMNGDYTANQMVTIPETADINLDLGGHTLYLYGTADATDSVMTKATWLTTMVNNGKLTITNGKVVPRHAAPKEKINGIVNKGTLTIQDTAKISSNTSIYEDAYMVVNLGGTVKTAGTIDGVALNGIVTYGGDVEITGGSITAGGDQLATAIAIFSRGYDQGSEGAEVTISGGEIDSATYAISTNNLYSGDSNLTITGGTIRSEYTAVYWPSAGTLTIGSAEDQTGPVISSAHGSAVEIASGTLNVYGGTLNGGTEMEVVDRAPVDENNVYDFRKNSGTSNAGDAITIAANRGSGYAAEPLKVKISGGTFNSTQNYGIRYMDCNLADPEGTQLAQDVAVAISNGSFTGEIAAVDASFVKQEDGKFVSGGSFSSSVSENVISTLNYEADDNGVYTYHSTLQDAIDEAGGVDHVTFVGQEAGTWSVQFVSDLVTVNSLTVRDKETFALPAALTKDGYTFTGWSDGTKTYQPGDQVTIEKDTTFTALWSSNYSGGGSTTTTKPVEEPKLPFTDVTGHWALDAITYVYKNGMMNGTTATKFGPEVELTRGMLVTILYRLEKEPAVSGSSAFTDVSSGMYYADAIAWAAKNGIVTGYTETTFGPEDSLTREQMAAILYRYASYKSYDVTAAAENLTGFSDAAQVSTYATESVNWAAGEGLLTGVTSTTLKPQGTATRAQVATILMRFCENIAK